MRPDEFGLRLSTTVLVPPTAKSYRPPSWPPPRDWVCVEDSLGHSVSCYGDPVWDFTHWVGRPMKLNFGDGSIRSKAAVIDGANADLLRLWVAWRLWGPRALRAPKTIQVAFSRVRSIFVFCSQQGILASDLMRFPLVRQKLFERIAKSGYRNIISELQWLLDSRETLGFVVLDATGINELIGLEPAHNSQQTPYIPPRIWNYQVDRLKLCLEEFQEHRQQIEECFCFCLDAYEYNYGVSGHIAGLSSSTRKHFNPFQVTTCTGARNGKRYYSFRQVAKSFGIADLIGRWVGWDASEREQGIKRFGTYLTLVRYVGFAYVLNFSLMRSDEGRSLRCDCLCVETDPIEGELYIISGETTKTDQDSDARWVVNPNSQIAIEAMAAISRLVMQYAKHDNRAAVSPDDLANPLLLGRLHLPWLSGRNVGLPYAIRPAIGSYGLILSCYPLLFDQDAIKITPDDLTIARKVTRNLDP